MSTEDKEADCTVTVSLADLEGVMNGSINPMMAFMTGKIKVKGDMGVVMKLQGLLK
ncbi:MAG: SCP2 sterol-binding domain-containing protein [Saprospiraceae bacterium]